MLSGHSNLDPEFGRQIWAPMSTPHEELRFGPHGEAKFGSNMWVHDLGMSSQTASDTFNKSAGALRTQELLFGYPLLNNVLEIRYAASLVARASSVDFSRFTEKLPVPPGDVVHYG